LRVTEVIRPGKHAGNLPRHEIVAPALNGLGRLVAPSPFEATRP
jgi:hypothetical protein